MEAKSKSERKAERFAGYPARSETLRRPPVIRTRLASTVRFFARAGRLLR